MRSAPPGPVQTFFRNFSNLWPSSPSSPSLPPTTDVPSTVCEVTHRVVRRGDVALAVTERRPKRVTAEAPPTLLFVHGYPDDQSVWDAVAERLAGTFHIVTFDVRGAGRSTVPAKLSAYSLEELSADIAAVADAVRPDGAVHLIGHDWGSIQAWEPITDPKLLNKFKSFTSISGPCLDHVGQGMRTWTAPVRGRLHQAIRSWYIGFFHLPVVAPTAWKLFGDRFDNLLETSEAIAPTARGTRSRVADGVHGISLYRANILPRLLAPRRRSTAIPVQILVPEDDAYVTPALTEAFEEGYPDPRLRRLVPNVERHLMPGGHWVLRSRPEAISTRIESFVARVEARTVTNRVVRLVPRSPRFILDEVPLHWLESDVQTTHTVNVLSLLLPAGEHWFAKVFQEALPHIEDPLLRQEMRGFAGQESNHAFAHEKVLALFEKQGLDAERMLRHVDAWFAFGTSEPFEKKLPPRLDAAWLRHRVALIAAVEQYTTFLGNWVLEADELASASLSSEMISLLRWHGAEEVEHRATAFDVFEALGGGYLERTIAMSEAFGALFYLWVRGIRTLMASDPTHPGPPSWRTFFAAGRRKQLPTFEQIGAATLRYVTPGFHPAQEAGSGRAAATLAGLSGGRLPGNGELRRGGAGGAR